MSHSFTVTMGQTLPPWADTVFKSFLQEVDPYLLNPITLALSMARGRYTHQLNGIDATFEADNLWETASLLHTFRKEATVFEHLIRSLRPDDTFYDVGANLGGVTCFANSVITEGTVVAFEPHPENTAVLRRNIEYNDGDAIVLECALSNESGTASLSVGLGRTGNQRHALTNDGDAKTTIEVETIAGDDLVTYETLSHPNVVKIDVEGAEMQVIEGMKKTLSRSVCRIVYCEIHPELLLEYDASPDQVRETLKDAGFALETIHVAGGQSYLKGEK